MKKSNPTPSVDERTVDTDESPKADSIYKVEFESLSAGYRGPVKDAINVLEFDAKRAIEKAETEIVNVREDQWVRLIGVTLLARADI